jgi:hypothetical protein
VTDGVGASDVKRIVAACLEIFQIGQTRFQRRGGAPQPPSPGNNRCSISGGIVERRASSATPSFFFREKSGPFGPDDFSRAEVEADRERFLAAAAQVGGGRALIL